MNSGQILVLSPNVCFAKAYSESAIYPYIFFQILALTSQSNFDVKSSKYLPVECSKNVLTNLENCWVILGKK